CCSTNCMPASAWSKPVNSIRLAASVASANASAVQRAACARASPRARHKAPPTIGSQTSRLSSGMEVMVDMRSSMPVAKQDGQQRDQAEDHHEGVVVEEAGLRLAQQAGHGGNHAGGAVDEESEIGRASCRERVEISVGAVSSK